MLPLGRLRLATRPNPTGSVPTLKTMGIVVVAPLAASTAGAPPPETITLTDEIGDQCRKSVVLTFRPTVFDRHILAFDITRFLQTLAERPDLLPQRSGRSGIEEADHGHRRLLRARRERPRNCRAAEQSDELAALDVCAHSITSSARPDRGSGTVMPSSLAVLRLMK